MASVQARIINIKALQKLVGSKEAELAGLQQEVRLRVGQLQAEIAKGGTTEDPLRDLVIRAYGLNEEITEQYRLLQNRLAGKRGEFVLIRYHAEVRERFGRDIRSSDFRHEQRFRIGILQNEKLRLTEGTQNITLPIDQYLPGVWQSGAWSVSAEKQPVKNDFFHWAMEDDPPALAKYMTEEHLAGDFFIGDEAVLAELKKNRDEKFFNTAAERLGRLILEPTEG